MEIVEFEPHHAEAFKTLNEAWIAKHFTLEPKDREVLGDPQGKILAATVKSGADIGFSVQREGRDSVQGTLVVKINGEWVPAEPIERVKY